MTIIALHLTNRLSRLRIHRKIRAEYVYLYADNLLLEAWGVTVADEWFFDEYVIWLFPIRHKWPSKYWRLCSGNTRININSSVSGMNNMNECDVVYGVRCERCVSVIVRLATLYTLMYHSQRYLMWISTIVCVENLNSRYLHEQMSNVKMWFAKKVCLRKNIVSQFFKYVMFYEKIFCSSNCSQHFPRAKAYRPQFTDRLKRTCLPYTYNKA